MASAKEIPPGGEGKIDVTFNTKNRRGKQSKKVTVLSNDSKEPKLILTVSADLKEVLGVEPQALNFGTIRWDETSTQTLQLIGEEVAMVKSVTVAPEDPTGGKKPIPEVIQGIRFKVLERVEPHGPLAQPSPFRRIWRVVHRRVSGNCRMVVCA